MDLPKTIHTTISALLIGALLTGCQQRPGENSERIAKKVNDQNFETKSSEKEADFVVETISSNYANVRFAEMAMERAVNSEVRIVAQVIEEDHNRLIKELKGFANLRGITIPLEENIQARKKLDNIAGSDEKTFDDKWCSELITRHEKLIESLEDMWEESHDDELKNWINSALPGLRENLVKLQTCHEKLST